MSALHKSEFWAEQCRLANPSSLNSIIYKIKTPEVSNGRFIVKYNVLFILNGQKPLSLTESAWLSSVLPRVLVEANLFARGVGQASRRALHLDHWHISLIHGGKLFLCKHWAHGLHPGLPQVWKHSENVEKISIWFRFWISLHYAHKQMLNLTDVFILNSHSMNMA